MRLLFCMFAVLFFAEPVWSQAASGDTPGLFMQLMPFLIMFFIFYFLVMRPQVKKQKVHQDFLTKLKKGDRVLTSSGIFGTIEGLNEKYVTLEVAQGVKIRVLKAYVSQPVKEG